MWADDFARYCFDPTLPLCFQSSEKLASNQTCTRDGKTFNPFSREANNERSNLGTERGFHGETIWRGRASRARACSQRTARCTAVPAAHVAAPDSRSPQWLRAQTGSTPDVTSQSHDRSSANSEHRGQGRDAAANTAVKVATQQRTPRSRSRRSSEHRGQGRDAAANTAVKVARQWLGNDNGQSQFSILDDTLVSGTSLHSIKIGEEITHPKCTDRRGYPIVLNLNILPLPPG